MNRVHLRLAAGALVSALCGSAAQAQNSAFTSALAAATFDTVWSKIDHTYYDTTFLATRWRILRDSLRPSAVAAKNNTELRAVLQALVSSVGVSHFGLIAGELSPPVEDVATRSASSEPGTVGASLRLIGSQLVFWQVDSGGPAWKAGLRPGRAVAAVNGTKVGASIPALLKIESEAVRRQALLTAVMRANTLLHGSVGDTATFTFVDHDEIWSTKVVLGPVRGRMLRFGNLPAFNAVVDVSERRVNGPNGPRRVGVIAFSVWFPLIARDLDRAFDKLRGADAIIIDLRGNPGGVAGMVSGFAGHMLDSTYMIGTLVQRTQTLKLTANPRRVSADSIPVPVRPFSGPVAILMDQLSASTSEFFAAGMQGLGRARVFGETSAGAALPALMDRLPNGDVLMHVVADLTDSKGRRVEGVGVIPDQTVPLSVASLSMGRDDALTAALTWAAAQKHTNK